jgi:hypothetical protein
MLWRVRPLRPSRPLLLLLVLVLAACKTMYPDIDQRTSQGPTAEELWTVQVMQQTGRAPSFEEKRHFDDDLDDRVGRYLRENQEAASASTLMSFRALKQVTVGMEKGQVETLLGPPLTTTKDAAQMRNFARRHWSEIRGKADEAWSYPRGWVFYFSKSKVIDITQHLSRT